MKCPIELCGYEGRSDNVKRHVKRKHKEVGVVTPASQSVISLAEAPIKEYGDSLHANKEIPLTARKSLSHKQNQTKLR